MNKSWLLVALSLVMACSHDDGTHHPKPDLTTPKGAASLALETLKKSVDAQNFSAFGFRALADAQAATLREPPLDEERFSVASASGGTNPILTTVPDTLTYAYDGPNGAVGEIMVTKVADQWKPVHVGAHREMRQINAILATVRNAGAQPRAIVRVRPLSEVYIRFEKAGVSRLAKPSDHENLPNESLEESLVKLREKIIALPSPQPPP